MNLLNWKYEIIDINESYSSEPSLSVLANAVDFLNLDFASKISSHSKVLEIGCGVQSFFKDNLMINSQWFGIDVFRLNSKGVRSIATEIASVGCIPFPENSFDFVLSNQSIEHWDEYYVSPLNGLREIFRILKLNGIAKINFPIHLHGSPVFVKGDFAKIDSFFEDSKLSIIKKVAVIDSSLPNYKGWRKCRFPDFYVSSLSSSEKTSYIVEYTVQKKFDHKFNSKESNSMNYNSSKFSIRSRPSIFLHLRHGPRYVIWKTFRSILVFLCSKIIKI